MDQGSVAEVVCTVNRWVKRGKIEDSDRVFVEPSGTCIFSTVVEEKSEFEEDEGGREK